MILFYLSQLHWYCTTSKEATAYCQTKAEGSTAFPPTCLQLHHSTLTAAPIPPKSLLGAVVGLPLCFFPKFPSSVSHFSNLNWYRRIQQAPEPEQVRSGRGIEVSHWFWWAIVSAYSMFWNYAWNFYHDSKQLDQRNREKAWVTAQWQKQTSVVQGGREGRSNHLQWFCYQSEWYKWYNCTKNAFIQIAPGTSLR